MMQTPRKRYIYSKHANKEKVRATESFDKKERIVFLWPNVWTRNTILNWRAGVRIRDY